MHTALGVGETHFEKCRDETSGRDVVTCHYPSLLYHFLYGVEAVGEVFGVLHCRNIIAHEAEALCECASSEALFVEGEVDMVNG